MILLLCSSWYGKQLSRGISTLGLYFPSRRFILSFTQDLSDHRFCNFCSKESRHYCRSNAIWINESITTSYALATRDVRKKYTSAALIGVQEKRSVYCLQTIKVRTSSSSSGSKPDWSKLVVVFQDVNRRKYFDLFTTNSLRLSALHITLCVTCVFSPLFVVAYLQQQTVHLLSSHGGMSEVHPR